MCAGKKKYNSEIQAAGMAGFQQFKCPGKLLRWYKCLICEKFHLTHTKKFN